MAATLTGSLLTTYVDARLNALESARDAEYQALGIAAFGFVPGNA